MFAHNKSGIAYRDGNNNAICDTGLTHVRFLLGLVQISNKALWRVPVAQAYQRLRACCRCVNLIVMFIDFRGMSTWSTCTDMLLLMQVGMLMSVYACLLAAAAAAAAARLTQTCPAPLSPR
jgi:hypothetical protein